ncbi:MAG TPA: GntR family transcriptional regulator [Rhizobium sp.]
MSTLVEPERDTEPQEDELAEPGKPKSNYNLSQLAYRSVSEAIHSRRLRGGEVIVEGKLSESLGVSRTPMREALQRLEGEGLVVKVANRSFMVRNVDFSEYMQALKVREILEPEAAVQAIGRISLEAIYTAKNELQQLVAATAYHTDAHWRSDDTVHGLYIDGAGNQVMADIIRTLRVTTRLYEVWSLKDRVMPDSREHLEILDNLESGDAKGVRRAVQSHLRSLQRYAVDSVST